jgi:hypothetical protein
MAPPRSSVSDPLGRLELDPDLGGQKRHIKIENSEYISCFHAGCYLLRAQGFCCSLDVLYRGLGISKLQFFYKKIHTFFQL